MITGRALIWDGAQRMVTAFAGFRRLAGHWPDFKTGGRRAASSAGSIPVRLR
jgi:hypothetical protein